MSLLRVENLSLAVPTKRGRKDIIKGISFEMEKGEVLGLVGESGSGKSMTARAITKLLPPKVEVISGSVYFDGVDLMQISEREMLRQYRAKRISILFQNAVESLNPVMSVGAHLEEMYALHTNIPSKARREAALDLLRSVHIPDVEDKYKQIPGLLSGGQAQRLNIAMNALITRPDLLIVDEATTALDVTIAAQVLDFLFEVARKENISVLFITHDFGLIAEYTDRVVVLQKGSVVEQGSVADIFERPKSVYVKDLLRDMLRVDKPLRSSKADGASSPVILDIHDLEVKFPIFGRKHLFFEKHTGDVRAIDGIDLSLREGEILGIVGESGCGKTTLMRSILNILPRGIQYVGDIKFWGDSIDDMSADAAHHNRQRVGGVSQNPAISLNPRMRIRDIIAEGMDIHNLYLASSAQKRDREKIDRVTALMESVGLEPSRMNDFTRRMSGGELQRVAIARALAVDPDILILDEPTASLDASLKHTILELLMSLQEERNLSYILITHELPTVASICDRVAVMYLGKIVEIGLTNEIFSRPQHPYTQLLLSSMPIPDPRRAKGRERVALIGEVPSAAHIPSGCRFRTRCPYEDEYCAEVEPVLEDKDNGQYVACHYSKQI